MQELQMAGDVVIMAFMILTTLVWPPSGSGAFWTLVGLYAVVSVLFDDETPRGNPGVNYVKRR